MSTSENPEPETAVVVDVQTNTDSITKFWKSLQTHPRPPPLVLPNNQYLRTTTDALQLIAQASPSSATKAASQSYEDAVALCKKKVEEISKTCRLTNRKYRDVHFDLMNDLDDCQKPLDVHAVREEGKVEDPEATWVPEHRKSEVARVEDIFEEPVFYKDGASASKFPPSLRKLEHV
jgi:hypothetical protein